MHSTDNNKMYYIAIIMVAIIFSCSSFLTIYVSSKEKSIDNPNIITLNGCKYIKLVPCE